MNRTMYKLVFAAYSSQFDKSMPIMEDVMILSGSLSTLSAIRTSVGFREASTPLK